MHVTVIKTVSPNTTFPYQRGFSEAKSYRQLRAWICFPPSDLRGCLLIQSASPVGVPRSLGLGPLSVHFRGYRANEWLQQIDVCCIETLSQGIL
jgi:hypothetical protein